MNHTIPEESVIVDGEVYAQHVAINQNYYHPTGEFIPFSAEDKRQTLLHRWSRILRRFAMNTALEEGDRRVSYAALNTLANRIAHAILARRVPKDIPVAAIFELESDLQIGLLAIWKAGNFFVWLEPEQPLARNQAIVEDSGALIVVTSQKYTDLARQLWPGEGQVIVIEELPDNLPLFDPPITIDASSRAYLMYTSGSTGKPKGTIELHRNLVAMLAVRERIFHFSSHDRVASMVHASGWSDSAAAALMYGGTSLAFHWRNEGLERILRWIKDSRVTILLGGPVVRLLLSSLDGSEEFPSLRVISGGDEPMVREQLLAYQQHMPDTCVLGNSYSAAECRSITLLILDKNSRFEGRILPVGFPTLHAEVEIWNERDRPVRAGETGEIIAITPYAVEGYWKSPELTASRFGVDWQDRRYYRTGDLGRLDEQGCLWIIGRIVSKSIEEPVVEEAVESPAEIEVPAVTANQETLDRLELDELLETQASDEAAKTPELTKLPETKNILGVGETLETIGDVGLTEILESTAGVEIDESVEATADIELTEILNAIEIPEEAENLEAVETLELTEIPEGVETQEIVESLDATETHVLSENLGSTEIPEVVESLETPESFEAVEMLEVQASLEPEEMLELGAEAPPETVETPELQESVDAPENVDLTEISETIEIPEETEIPETVNSFVAEIVDTPIEFGLTEIPETNEILEAAKSLDTRVTLALTEAPEFVETLDAPESLDVAETVEVVENLETSQGIDITPGLGAEETVEAAVIDIIEEVAAPWTLETSETPEATLEAETIGSLELAQSPETTPRLAVGEIFDVPESLDMAAIADLTEIPDVAEFPEMQEELDMLASLESTESAEKREIPEVEVTAILGLSETPEAMETPMTVEAPVRAETDEAPVTFELTEVPATIEVPEVVGTFDVEETLDAIEIPDTVATPEMAEAIDLQETFELSEIPATTEIPEIVARDERSTRVEVAEIVTEIVENEASLEAIESVEPLPTLAPEEILPVEATTLAVESLIVDRTFLQNMQGGLILPRPSVTEQPFDTAADDSEPEISQPTFTEVAPIKIPAPRVELLLPKESVVVNGETFVQHVKLGQQNYHPTGEHVPITPAEQEKTLLHRFGRMVERFDSNPAIEDGNRVLSYVEFNALANRIAHALIAAKLSPKQPVAVLCDRETDLYIGTFAVWKAGLFFVWMEPQQPLARNKSIVEDSGATVVISNRKHADLARQLFSNPTAIYVAEEMTSGYPSYDPEITLQPASPAYVMYPSGSTGKLKGVLEVHRNLMEMLVVRQSFLHFSNQERVIHLSLASGWAFASCAALMYGGCLLPYRAKDEGPTRFSQWLIDRRITIASGGAMLRPWLLSLDGSQKFPNLRLVGLDDGASYQQQMQAYQRNLADRCLLLISYSAIECQTVSLLVIDKSCMIPSRLLPTGFPTAHVVIEIWSDLKRPLPVGETGEVVVFTSFAAQSYWNSPELTKSQFGVDAKGRRYYRMGDVGRLDENGALWVLGRKDGQVQIRGNRVDLAEVEVALMDVPNVKEVALIHSGATDVTRFLTAFVTTSTPTTGNEVRKEVERRLPSTMVPATVSVLEEFPRNANGEIDRSLLQDVAAGVAKIPTEKSVRGAAPVLRTEPTRTESTRTESTRTESTRSVDPALETQKQVPLSLPSHFKSTFRIDAVKVMPGTPGNRPFFLCPGGNGSLRVVRRFQNLMRGLGNQRPLYGLVVADSDEASGLYKNIDELVTASLFALRHIQPHGPYTLIGESIGGKLAYEMAGRLEKEGERVALLVLLDAPFRGSGTQGGSGNWLQRFFSGLRGKSGGQGGNLADYALQSNQDLAHLFQRRYLEILKKFEPSKSYASPTLALFTRQYEDHRRRWEKLLPAIKVTIVEGVHDDYLRLSSGKVVGLLRQAIEGTPAPQKKAVNLGSRQRTPITRDTSRIL